MSGNTPSGERLDVKLVFKYLVILCVGIVLGYMSASSSITQIIAGTTRNVGSIGGLIRQSIQQLNRKGMSILDAQNYSFTLFLDF